MNANRLVPASERYALTRRGLPLPHGTPSVPRAPWLPASLRSLALPGNAQVPAMHAPLEAQPGEAGVPAAGRATPPPAAATDARGGPHVSENDGLPAPGLADRWHDGADSGRQVAATADAAAASLHTATEPDRALASVIRPAPARPAPGRAGAAPVPASPPGPASEDATPTRPVDAPPAPVPATLAHRAPSAALERSPAPGTTQGEDGNARDPNRVLAMAAAPAVTPARTGERVVAAAHARRAQAESQYEQSSVRLLSMGFPADPMGDRQPPPATSAVERAAPVHRINAVELAALLQPASPTRSVRIDRVQVAVQAPASPAAPFAGIAAASPAAAQPAPPTTAFHSPWSSYFTRRD